MDKSYGNLNSILWALTASGKFVICMGVPSSPPLIQEIEGDINRFGYERDRLLQGQLNYIEILHPDDTAHYLKTFQTYLKDQIEHFTLHYRIRNRTGSIHWIEDHVSIRYDKEGKAATYVSILYDQSAFINKHQELQETKNRLDQAQAITHIGSWELDLVDDVLNWSDEIYRIFEIDPEQFGASYEAFLDAIHPDDRDMVNEAYTNSLITRQPYRIEHRLRMKDGSIKFVEERCKTTFNSDGTPLKSVGTVQDITRQKANEQALQEQRQLLRNVIDSTPDLIFYKDYKYQNGCYLGCNHAFELFTGLEESELLGRNDIEVFGDEIGSFFRGKDLEVLRRGESIANEEWVTYPDGREVLLQTIKTPLFDRLGDIRGIVGTSRDITDRWVAEQKIKEQQEKLQHQARYDALTDLPNRNLFNEELHNAIHRPHQERDFFALFFIDLDNFKVVNDSFGHAVGDEVLIIIATRLRHIFRQEDTIARFGGDEFLVLVKSLEKIEYTEQLAQKILTVFEEPIRIGGHSFNITASIGISLYPQDAPDVKTLIKQADQAMYRAKENGRNTYRFYRP